jgi:hypothetical protein
VVIDLPNGMTVKSNGVAEQLRGLDAQITKGMPALREISYASTGNEALVSNGGRSTILLVYPPAAGSDVPATVLDELSAAARTAVPGATVHSTGVNALASGNASSGGRTSLSDVQRTVPHPTPHPLPQPLANNEGACADDGVTVARPCQFW